MAAPKTISVKLHADVVESARIISACRSESMTELLSGLLRSTLKKMELEAVSEKYGITATPQQPKPERKK